MKVYTDNGNRSKKSTLLCLYVLKTPLLSTTKIPSTGLTSQSLGSSHMIGRLIIILTVDRLDLLTHELSVVFESLYLTVHLVNEAVALLA